MQDIYGDSTEALGLPPDLIASSLAKAEAGASREDLAASLLFMSAWTVAQLACIEAEKSGATEVFFVGGFAESPLARQMLVKCTQYAGGGRVTAVFVQYASHLGVLGAAFADVTVTERTPQSG